MRQLWITEIAVPKACLLLVSVILCCNLLVSNAKLMSVKELKEVLNWPDQPEPHFCDEDDESCWDEINTATYGGYSYKDEELKHENHKHKEGVDSPIIKGIMAKKLRDAEALTEEGDLKNALNIYNAMLNMETQRCYQACLGKAQILMAMAEQKSSQKMLEMALQFYLKLFVDFPDTPNEVLLDTADKLIESLRSKEKFKEVELFQKDLVEMYPNNATIVAQLGLSYFMIGQNGEAKKFFESAVSIDPFHGMANAHLGMIAHMEHDDDEVAVKYLKRALDYGSFGTNDGSFYVLVGDCLRHIGQEEESQKVYEKAVSVGLFPSVHQRSVNTVPEIQSKPFWNYLDFAYGHYLEDIQKDWEVIRDEGLALVMDKEIERFKPDPVSDHLTRQGQWRQFILWKNGRKNEANCRLAPHTCKLLEKVEPAVECTKCQIKFSLLQPDTKVWPHCGQSNARLRTHLGLVVPRSSGVKIRVHNETRSWMEGRFLVFDDSFEHEVWNESDNPRLILIVDFWHPELSQDKRDQFIANAWRER